MSLFDIAKRLAGPRLDADLLNDVDLELVEFAVKAMEPLARYFRAEVRGLDRLPDGPALLVGNHNAGITFMEPFFLGRELFLQKGKLLHYLAHDAMVSLPLVGNLLMGVGAIRASHDAADKAFSAGKKVVVFPGGNYEAFRPYAERDQVDFKGRTGYVRLALRNKVPIVPIASVGGHETFFVIKRGQRIAEKLGIKRYLRSDSFPLFLGLPWGIGLGPIFHLPLPAKLEVEVGDPIEITEDPETLLNDHDALRVVGERVEAAIQSQVAEMMKRRRWPVLG